VDDQGSARPDHKSKNNTQIQPDSALGRATESNKSLTATDFTARNHRSNIAKWHVMKKRRKMQINSHHKANGILIKFCDAAGSVLDWKTEPKCQKTNCTDFF